MVSNHDGTFFFEEVWDKHTSLNAEKNPSYIGYTSRLNVMWNILVTRNKSKYNGIHVTI